VRAGDRVAASSFKPLLALLEKKKLHETKRANMKTLKGIEVNSAVDN
jgi:hypothetical protein